MKFKSLQILILGLAAMQVLSFTALGQGIEITSGGTVTVTSNATIELKNQGLINNGTYTKGTETILFSGTTAKALSGSSSTDLYNVSVTNTGGITTHSGLLTSHDFTIASGCKFTIDAGMAVKVTGALINGAGNAGLVVRSASSSAGGTGSLENLTPGVPATIERYMSGDIWHLISPAATGGETVAEFVGGSPNDNSIARNTVNYGLAPYAETNDTWDYYKISGSNTSGSFGAPCRGFQLLRAAGTGTGQGNPATDGIVSFKGTLAATDQSISVEQTGNGWNLIGNPYPCALDINAFLSENNQVINPSYLAIYVSNTGDVSTYGYTPVNNSTNLKLSSGEGFFIKSAAGTNTVNFTTQMKSTVSDAFKSGNTDYPGVALSAETGSEKINTWVKFIPGMNNGLDPGWDAGLFNGGEAPFSLSTRLVEDNGVDFAIQCLPDINFGNSVVSVNLTAAVGSRVIFKAQVTNLPQGYRVYLEDKVTGVITRLDEEESFYSVSLTGICHGSGRFFLHTTLTELQSRVLNDFVIAAVAGQQFIRVAGEVQLPAKATVYDMAGKAILTQSLTNSDVNDIQMFNHRSGIYLLMVESDSDRTTQKFCWVNN